MVFSRLGIRVAIKLNNRKILAGIAELIGEPDKLVDITVAIDKIDKIGLDNVNAELAERGLSPEAIVALRPILEIDGSGAERIEKLAHLLASSETGAKGVEELRTVYEGALALGMTADLDIDVSLARGLNYYTGTMPRSAVFPAADDMTTLRVCSVWRESPEWESRSEQTAYMMSFLRSTFSPTIRLPPHGCCSPTSARPRLRRR